MCSRIPRFHLPLLPNLPFLASAMGYCTFVSCVDMESQLKNTDTKYHLLVATLPIFNPSSNRFPNFNISHPIYAAHLCFQGSRYSPSHIVAFVTSFMSTVPFVLPCIAQMLPQFNLPASRPSPK